MSPELLNLQSYPRAIVHLDGDAFFTSVEQAIHPEWKGKPVVTGKERGIIACASYEAKKLGIARGITLRDAIRLFPQLIVLPSDYETYSLYSKRMFDVMRRYTPIVEEYSIDEGFADLSGVRRVFHASYEDIARRMQNDIHAELDITVSVGLSLSKGLAKLASKFRKPAGFTAIDGREIHTFLQNIPLEAVWGFGPNTVQLLSGLGLKTAYDFATQSEPWASKLMGKLGREIWNELRGTVMCPVGTEAKSTYCTISKCRTFTAPSRDRDFIWAKLVRNLESAFIKARRYHLRPQIIAIALRQQDFHQDALEARLNRSTSSTQEAVPVIRDLFELLFKPETEYRATIVALGKLESDQTRQYELFDDPLKIEKMERMSHAIDEINKRYGKHTLSLGTSLLLDQHRTTARDDRPTRKTCLLPGETPRRRLKIPRLMLPV